MAIDAETGKEVWRTEMIADYVGCTMAVKGDKLVYQTAHGVFCFNARTGAENWAVKKDIAYGVGSRPNTLVLTGDAVYSEEGKNVYAYALADGRDYWGKSIAASKGYEAPTDILIAADALWMCGTCNKLVQENFNHRKMWTTEKTEYPTGDIIVSDGTDYYSVFGMPVNRGSTFNPRNGYALIAKTRSGDSWSSKWTVRIPITGKAMALVGDTVFVAGAPLVFKLDDLAATYEGRSGGVLWATSAEDGSKVAEYELDELPAWDGLAAASGPLFIVNQDGSIDCWGGGPE